MAGSHTSKIWRKTVVITVLLLVLGFGVVIGNLVRWQIVRGEELRMDAVDQSLQSTSLTPMRGTIYDASGSKILAQSATVWTVALEPRSISVDDGDDVKIAQILSEELDVDYSTVLEKTHQNSYFTYVKRKIETDLRDRVLERLESEGVGSGVMMVEDYKRYYPYGTTASTVLGFTGTDGQGLAGIETYYDDELTGTAGRIVSAKNSLGGEMPFDYEQYIEAQNGYDLVLTLDETVQSIVEKHLQAGLEACGAQEGGTAIVMNVHTGAIIALATKGDYDPNDPFTLDPAVEEKLPEKADEAVQKALKKEDEELALLEFYRDIAISETEKKEAEENLRAFHRMTAEEISELREEEYDKAYSEAQNKQWRNKAVSDTYYPGSVFKMFTASAALESGAATLDTSYTCVGQWDFNLPGVDPISCWHAGHGLETLSDGVTNSCNPFMIYLGQLMGPETFFKFFEAFGFTERTGVDLPGEAGSIYYDEDELGVTELATESFGQNFAVTPIQVITGICAVANGGYLIQPHIVDRILDSEGNIVRSAETGYKRQVISREVSEQITKILLKNATSESGKNGYVPGFRIAGKTGTSEKIAEWEQAKLEDPDAVKQYIVSYGGFAPADDPQYALLVFYDEPQIGTASGGAQAGPYFAAIMKEILPYLGVDAKYTPEEFENLAASTPNVIGRTIGEAKQILEEGGFTWSVEGYDGDNEDAQPVYTQVPSPGTEIPKEGNVALFVAELTDEDYTEVPSFVGCSLTDCEYLANLADLQIVITGSGEGYAQSQSVDKGARVKRDSVVTISFVNDSEIETAAD